MADPLSATNLIAQSQSLIDPSASLTSPASVLALLVHSIHTALSFRLSSPTNLDDSQATPSRLTQEWTTESNHKFKYKHDQSSLEFVVSVVDLGDKVLLVGNAVDNPRTASFEVRTTDYFSPTSISSSRPVSVRDLSPTNPFATATRLDDLIHLYRLNILQKLIPALRKEGYTELAQPASGTSASSNSGSVSGSRGLPPLAGTRDYLPDHGGPLGMFPPSTGGSTGPRPIGDDPLRIPGSGGMPRPIGEIGRNDLDPLGGLGGTFGTGRLPGGGGAGGMFMGPDHPLFRERFEGGNGGSALQDNRRWGGDGYLPPIGAPPGARFDPVGPENGLPGSTGPAFGLPQGTFGPGGPSRRGGAGGMGGGGRVHPDLEQPGRFGGGGSDYDAMFG
ncbi:proteasome inhibitor PI31 family protein [Sporobolomyces koalae]|uniref:proteasome inhibitor PI31 family protein n=1 Tax=Sporobolomyces koalae TaxID=500713 RepID=UPI0031796B27